jgi:hypothetical protein
MTSHEPYWKLFNLDSKANLVLHRYDFHEPYWELFNLDSKANLVLPGMTSMNLTGNCSIWTQKPT